MQTFLPYDDFRRSLRCLDDKRLGKQRVEAWQILVALANPDYGWQHHPAVRMWRGFDLALSCYYNIAVFEWKQRGFHNSMSYVNDSFSYYPDVPLPSWLGRRSFHYAHRSNLVRKYPKHYRQFFPKVADSLPYVWPS
jgi:hypothetical protein